MRQARCVLSTYSSDTFGVCSALYELGGMVVMHDASGCNSTYSTHDEPRWFDSDSLVFISGLTEMEAIMGDDGKVTTDMLDAIAQLHPRFAALAGTPIPMMTGCDYQAIAGEVERESGIPCFGFATNGMRSYLCGASEALEALATHMTSASAARREGTVNILGATPLDFSLSGTVSSIKALLRDHGYEVIGCWAMDTTLEDIARAGEAAVNLVISSVGMKAARALKERFGTPYVVGTPVGGAFTRRLLEALDEAARDGRDRLAFADFVPETGAKGAIIGESVTSRSLAAAIKLETGRDMRVICPLEDLEELSGIMTQNDLYASEEEEIAPACEGCEVVIADPLYRRILPGACRFIALPHEAFSGRIARGDIPDLTKVDIQKMMGGND